MKHSQPAQLSYFFHGGFIDLSKVITGAFEHCGEIISRSAEGISEAWGNLTEKFSYDGFWSGLLYLPVFIGKFGFYLVRLIATAVITPFICFSITVFQITLLLAFFSVA